MGLSKSQLAARRQRVGELYCTGWSQVAIAKEMDISQPTVSRDINYLQDEVWPKETAMNLDAMKGRELKRNDYLEATAWEAWRRSIEWTKRKVKDDRGVERTIMIPASGRVPFGAKGFLDVVGECIDRRIKLLGLEPPKNINLGLDEEVMKYVGIDDKKI